ncbi:hypothetical protein B4090_4737 [Bacillus licheniformis]|nr:hypothetical protein B4090_4737 [Bacillus licheniformis]
MLSTAVIWKNPRVGFVLGAFVALPVEEKVPNRFPACVILV